MTPPPSPTYARGLVYAFVVSALLSACGGGGGTAGPTPAPSPAPAPAPAPAPVPDALDNVQGLLCTQSGSRGWCLQRPSAGSLGYSDSMLVSPSIAYAVGEKGLIVKTVDGGLTWSLQSSGLTAYLNGVFFSSPEDGWVRSIEGHLLRTSDGGAHWTITRSPDPAQPSDLPFFGLLTVISPLIAVTPDGQLTTDGGKTWNNLNFSPTAVSAGDVFWRLAQDGSCAVEKSTDFGRTSGVVLDARSAVSGAMSQHGLWLLDEQTLVVNCSPIWPATPDTVLFYSFDGGGSWQRVDPKQSDGGTFGGNLRVLRASSADRVQFGISGSVGWLSTDAGATWSQVALPCSPSGGAALATGSTVMLQCLVSFRPGRPELFPDSYEYGLWVSNDSGRNWSRALVEGSTSLPGTLGAPSIRHLGGTAFALQQQGGSYLSTDGGRTWSSVVAARKSAPYRLPGQPWSPVFQTRKLALRTARHALLLDDAGRVRETLDGGLSWSATSTSGWPDKATNVSLQFITERQGLLLQSDGRVYATADGGMTWDTGQQIASGLRELEFQTALLGWGRQASGGGLVFTRDGGKSWIAIEAPELRGGSGLWIGPGQQLLMYGGENLLARSMDDGKTWTRLLPAVVNSPHYAISKVTSSDGNLLWMVGYAGLQRSNDGGVTWTTQYEKASLSDVAFATTNVGWAIGRFGVILATTDGGTTWTEQATFTTRELGRLVVANAKSVWITGEDDLVLATGSGGF